MTDTIKRELSSPENCVDENVKVENVEKWLEPGEEVTVMKTEVIEESGDFKTADQTDLMPLSHYIFLSEDEMVLKCEDGLEMKNMGFDSCRPEKERFEEDIYKLEKYFLENDTANIKKCQEYHCETSESPKKINKDRAIICGICKVEVMEEDSYEQHLKWCERNCLRLNKEEDTSKNVLKCTKCSYTTKSNFYLKQHYNVHLKKKRYKCTHKNCSCVSTQEIACGCGMCTFTTTKKNYLKYHILMNHSGKEKKYKCIDCKYSAEREEVLVRHMRIHTNEKLFKCDACEFITKRNTLLKEHVLVKHSDEEKKYKCANCEYSTHVRRNLVKHVCIHIREKLFQCGMCEYAANQKTHLRKHVLIKHSNKEKNHNCKDCSYSTHRKGDLARHRQLHGNQKLFKCDTCEYSVNKKIELKCHTLAKHSDIIKKHKCTYCKYSTSRRRDLIRHVSIHIKRKPFQCNICEYGATQKTLLTNHMLIKHSSGEKKHTCSDCKYSTHIKEYLAIHMRIHIKEKPFRCKVCEFATAHSYQLKKHVLTKHSDEEKKHKCMYCVYSTHVKADLIVHMRIHSNEKPFKCNICEFAGTRRSQLKQHMLTKHSDEEKKYKCTDCKYSTNRKRDLLRHMHIHSI